MDNKGDTALKILQKYDNDAKAIKFIEAMQKNDVATVMDLVNNQGVEPCGVYKKPDVSPDEV